MELSGSRALVTGASSGIGRSLAVELAKSGCRMSLAARREDLLNEVADEIELIGAPRPQVIVADLGSPGAASKLADQAVGALGHIDLLVNNAGGAVNGYQAAVGDREEARETFEINVWSPVALTAEVVPGMRARRTGAVVNVTSVMQVMTWPMMGYYTASKAALGGLTEALRLELAGSGVHVLEVVPGAVATPMQAESMLVPGFARGMRGGRPGKPEVLARAIVKALRRDRARVVYPRPLRFLYARPLLMRRFAARQAKRVRKDFDVEDTRIMRSGSQGDELARRARAAWEQGERDPAKLQALAAQKNHQTAAARTDGQKARARKTAS